MMVPFLSHTEPTQHKTRNSSEYLGIFLGISRIQVSDTLSDAGGDLRPE
jgi:hypothetical protein